MEVCLAIELSSSTKSKVEDESLKIFNKHKEFLWFDPQEYRIPLFTWSAVEVDMIPKLTEKLEAILFETDRFTIFAHEYVVKISSRIDIFLQFQHEAKFTRLIRTLGDGLYGTGRILQEDFPMLAIARYKIPAKQQYSHLKNDLAKLKTEVEIPVESLSLVHVTQFGKGASEGKELSRISIIKNL